MIATSYGQPMALCGWRFARAHRTQPIMNLIAQIHHLEGLQECFATCPGATATVRRAHQSRWRSGKSSPTSGQAVGKTSVCATLTTANQGREPRRQALLQHGSIHPKRGAGPTLTLRLRGSVIAVLLHTQHLHEFLESSPVSPLQ